MSAVVTLLRSYRETHTPGNLILPSGKVLACMERPWLNNQSNISCIPAGFYEVHWMDRSDSGKYRRCWHIQDVPNRSGILIHKGNLVTHTLGCQLPGKSHGYLGEHPAVLASGTAMNELRRELEQQNFIMFIHWGN